MASATPAVVAVADDDEAIRTALSSLIRSMGYGIRLFGTAEEYLADRTVPPPDCLVTDIQMPGLGGLALLAEVRTRMPDLPVIIVTAFPQEAVQAQAMAGGALHVLNKPFSADAFARCLARALGR